MTASLATAIIVIGFTFCSFALALLAGCRIASSLSGSDFGHRVGPRDLDPALGDDFCRDRDDAA